MKETYTMETINTGFESPEEKVRGMSQRSMSIVESLDDTKLALEKLDKKSIAPAEAQELAHQMNNLKILLGCYINDLDKDFQVKKIEEIPSIFDN